MCKNIMNLQNFENFDSTINKNDLKIIKNAIICLDDFPEYSLALFPRPPVPISVLRCEIVGTVAAPRSQ